MLSPTKPLVVFSSPLASDISCEFLIWYENRRRTGVNLTSRRQIYFARDSLPAGFASTKDQDIAGSSVYDMPCHIDCQCSLKRSFVCIVLLKCDPPGVKGDSEGALTGMGPRSLKMLLRAALCSVFNHCADFVAGKFREKASILHKIAKKKCQVEDSEKANGVASRSGKELFHVHLIWLFGWIHLYLLSC